MIERLHGWFNRPTGHTGQSFMDLIKSAKGFSQDDNLDEEDDFVLKKVSPSPVCKGLFHCSKYKISISPVEVVCCR